ncbi:MAG: redox-sensing transcriptional repressor Rex [Phycisphaerales bacterium]|nr:redox-sensing transcriptional repressor Rex [Phycisphaerales bacterium]
MSKSEGIPAPAVRRLSLYLRQLEALRETNLHTVSSKQLGQALRFTDAQVRKDLAYFGQFGQPGIGYDVNELIARLRSILGTDRTWRVLLVGAGNLGRALLAYRGFGKRGFEIAAVFDTDPAKVGKPSAPDFDMPVRHIDELADAARDLQIRLAVLAVPAPVAQSIAESVVAAGIRGILNFAPIALHLPPTVTVVNVDLAVQLEQLSFNVSAGIAPSE